MAVEQDGTNLAHGWRWMSQPLVIIGSVQLSDLFAVAAGLMATAAGVFLGGFVLDRLLFVVGRAVGAARVEGARKESQLICGRHLNEVLKRRADMLHDMRSASVIGSNDLPAIRRSGSSPVAPALLQRYNYSAARPRSCLVDHIIQLNSHLPGS